MSASLAEHLAERFAADARALRQRVASLERTTSRGTPGPDAARSRRMADACERVQTLFASVADTADDETVRALLPTLAGLVAGATSDEERHVYAGAVARAREGLDAAARGVDDMAADDEALGSDDDGDEENDDT